MRTVVPKTMLWYIYALIDPRNGTTRYVGRTINPNQRLKGHVYEGKNDRVLNPEKAAWIRELFTLGLQPEMQILETGQDLIGSGEYLWSIAERNWIRTLREADCDLLNRTEGGERCVPFLSPASRERQSRRSKLYCQTEEGKLHLRKATDAAAIFLKGKPPSRAALEATRKAHLNSHPSPEARAKMSASHSGVKLSPEHAAHIAAALRGINKGRVLSQETRAKLAASHRGLKASPETRAKMSKSRKLWFAKRKSASNSGLLSLWER